VTYRKYRTNCATHTYFTCAVGSEGYTLKQIPYERLTHVSTLLERDGLLATWRRLTDTDAFGRCDGNELDEHGDTVTHSRPSARRQIVLTDVFCQITEQMGHLAAMCVAVTTPTFGIRVPDVVWMPPEKWENFDRDDPVPFVPDLCVEVLLDSDRTRDLGRRIESYLGGGAREVIVIDPFGHVQYWGPEGRREASIFGVTPSPERMYFEEGSS
jgi:hypothetical protein